MTIHNITAGERSIRQLQHASAWHARSSYIKRKPNAAKQSKEQIKDVKGILRLVICIIIHQQQPWAFP